MTDTQWLEAIIIFIIGLIFTIYGMDSTEEDSIFIIIPGLIIICSIAITIIYELL